jgi:hypothetical protein
VIADARIAALINERETFAKGQGKDGVIMSRCGSRS